MTEFPPFYIAKKNEKTYSYSPIGAISHTPYILSIKIVSINSKQLVFNIEYNNGVYDDIRGYKGTTFVDVFELKSCDGNGLE